MTFQKGELVRATFKEGDGYNTVPRWDIVQNEHDASDQIKVDPGDTLMVEGLTTHPDGEWWHLRHLKSGSDVCWRWNDNPRMDIFGRL